MNPLSTTISLPFELNTFYNIGPEKGRGSNLNVKPIYPLKLKEWNLINRFIIPVAHTEGQGQELEDNINMGWGNTLGFGVSSEWGLGDVVYQGFLSPAKTGKVAWGVGASVSIPTNTDDRFGTDLWSVGPSFVVFAPLDKWVLGAIVENVWSVAGDDDESPVNTFTLQPTINYKLSKGWYLTSAPLISADWKADKGNRWAVPLGGGLGKLFRLKKQAIAVDFGVYYFVERPEFYPNMYTQALVNFLFSKKKR
jgi:hypothetical protein